ncbi:hypothetical protein K458DRAFT_406023 [Lentithecium fluviatile CBS 122367]|uniref:Uncharacterized protein n=1 Tax=Lentithecium fluviatile CBS 122367 TaxID=1168545 RepID=A0A6G1IVZ8_9PLEO|nr:hypothetical protein K458DRAFT_406023 [Lentithecium fluviatile CBS 122367]
MSFCCHSFRSLVLRAPTVRSPLLAKRLSPIAYGFLPSLQKYSSAASGGTARDPKRAFEQPISETAVDAAEKFMKERFGDHANWSHEQLKALQYADCLVPIQDVGSFAAYAHSGHRPGGGFPSFPLMTEEEFTLMDMPYHRWAPAPYSNLNYSPTESLRPLWMDVGESISPYTGWFSRLRVLRVKLWNGMVPMSHERWLQKKMDDPQNYRNMFELMEDIFTIFAWLGHEQTLDRMRSSYNWMVDKYVEFEGAVNALREKKGVEERLDMAGMWAEYYHSIITTMSNRTHKWLVDRVGEIQTRAFDEYTAALERAGSDQEAIATAGKNYYGCVQDLNAMITKADYILDIPMVGFKGYKPSGSASDLTLVERQNAYMQIGAHKSWKYQEIMLNAQDADDKVNPPKQKDIMDIVDEMKNGRKPAEPRFRNKDALIGHYHEGKKNRAEIRIALRGEQKSLGEEFWVTELKERLRFYLENGRDRETHRWGFVCYRLTYKQTDEEWADVKKKLEADIFKSGQWIEGYDTITDMAGLEFIDGRDVGIAEGDIEAAKRHFKSTYTLRPALGRLWTSDFLVVDLHSYISYAQPEPEERPPPPYGPCFGDRGGFIRLVDTREYNPQVIDAESPGYKGELKVLSSLVLEEVYPLVASSALTPSSLWPLARLHPREVYVGHTVGSQEYWWEFNNIDTVSMNQAFLKHLREKAKQAKGEEQVTDGGDKRY